jgi:ABC-type glycerol-3-phosphate transport system permease component
MRQFFIALPAELEEAGRLDGLGRPALWWRIFLPLAKPAPPATPTARTCGTPNWRPSP